MADIDDLLNFINDDKATAGGKKKKKKKGQGNQPEAKKEEDKKEVVENKKEEEKKVEIKSEESKKEENNKKEDEEGDEHEGNEGGEGDKKKKKKKKHHKKQHAAAEEEQGPKENPYKQYIKWDGIEINNSRAQDNSQFRIIGSWQEKEWTQTNYPTKDIDELFPNKDYPVGVLMEYDTNNLWRSTDKQKQEEERLREFDIVSLRKAGECHRQIRKYAQRIIKPGIKLIDMCIEIEKMLKFITNHNGLKSGQAFPTGCSLNNVAAHYTPNSGDETVLQYDDVMKLDFGTHINGLLIDTAFTVAFNPIYDNLLKSSWEATRTGIKLAGIDARLGEVGAGIQEVLESFEVEIKGKTHKIKSVRNLCGHTMEAYRIHSGKSVPIIKSEETKKMEEGEIYAIETFASTGKGIVKDDGETSHYMKSEDAEPLKIKSDKARNLFNFIDKNFSTLAFCRRWLDEGGFTQHSLALRQLLDGGMITPYPPLADVEGSYVAQFEHTLMLKPTGKEIFSMGDDY